MPDEQARLIGRIAHRDDDCTGNWRLKQGDALIYCDRCGVTYPSEALNRLAAIDENYAGIYLRRLTTEGQYALRREREP